MEDMNKESEMIAIQKQIAELEAKLQILTQQSSE